MTSLLRPLPALLLALLPAHLAAQSPAPGAVPSTSGAGSIVYQGDITCAAKLEAAGFEGNVRVSGHTCDLGPAAHNLKLSQRRANAVRDALAPTGAPAQRILAEGEGEGNPRYPNTKAERPRNRRVDVHSRGNAFAVLANDRDPDGDMLVVVSFTQPLNGTVTRGPGNTLVYRAYDGYVGFDGFGYEIADGRGGTARARVGVFADP